MPKTATQHSKKGTVKSCKHFGCIQALLAAQEQLGVTEILGSPCNLSMDRKAAVG